MGKKKFIKFYIVLCVLAAGALTVYSSAEPGKAKKVATLGQTLAHIPGYDLAGSADLTADVIQFLDLDDYFQSEYLKGNTSVLLYVGYYNSLAKLSAAHSPLACFPGQGWQILSQEKQIKVLDRENIRFNTIIVGKGELKLLVAYWYQAGTKTEAVIYKNKLNALVNKLRGGSQEHAFVRVSVPLYGKTNEEAFAEAAAFIRVFYPRFVEYVNLPMVAEFPTS